MSNRFRPEENRLSGIIGSAIALPEVEAVPPRTPKPKVPSTATRPKPVINNNPAPPSSAGCTCGLSEKLVKSQIAERDAKAKLDALSRSCEDLKKEIAKNLSNNNESLQVAETKWKMQHDALESRLKTEINAKEDATRRHAKCDEKIAELHKELDHTRTKHSEEIEKLKKRHEDELAALRKDRDEQIAARDEKLQKLKTQIADKLTGNSSERQKQIDDLLKEMNKLQEEHEILKAKLKAYGQAKNIHSVCESCTTSNARVKVLEERLKDREILVAELRAMCDKFDRQLKQNDHLAALANDFDKSRFKKK